MKKLTQTVRLFEEADDALCWCGACEAEPYWRGRWQQDGGDYSLVRCTGCGAIRTDAPMEPRREEYFYTAADARIEAAAEHVASFLDTGTVLDVGCNTGLLVEALAKRGFTALGCDTDARAAEEGRRLGRAVICGDIAGVGKRHRQLAGVVFNHVLEHLEALPATLKTAACLLAENGRLFIFAPNINSLRAQYSLHNWAPLIPREHLWHFAPHTLVGCVTTVTDLRLIDLRTTDLHAGGARTCKEAAKTLLRRAAAAIGCGEQICATFVKDPAAP